MDEFVKRADVLLQLENCALSMDGRIYDHLQKRLLALPSATPSGECTTFSAEDFARFIDACENPAPPTEALLRLVREYGSNPAARAATPSQEVKRLPCGQCGAEFRCANCGAGWSISRASLSPKDKSDDRA